MACRWCEDGYPFHEEGINLHVVKNLGDQAFRLEVCDDAKPEIAAEVEAALAAPAPGPAPGPEEPEPELKETNPKDWIGATKLPLSLVPATAIAVESLAFLNGALKYGRSNFRISGVRASIYLDACRRHLAAWENGEEVDLEGVPHLGSARACLAIILDSRAANKLNDDRPPSVGLQDFFDSLTPTVGSLQELHASRRPRHYTIADTERHPCEGCTQGNDATCDDGCHNDEAGLRLKLKNLRDALRESAKKCTASANRAMATTADEIDDILRG